MTASTRLPKSHPQRPLRREDFDRRELALFAVWGVIGFAVMAGAALDVALLAGPNVLYALGFLATAAAHGFVGAALVGILLKWRHDDWGPVLRELSHWVMPSLALGVGALLVLVDLWVLHISLGPFAIAAYVTASTAGAAAVGWGTYLVLDPRRLTAGAREALAVGTLSSIVGFVLGALLVVATICGFSYVRQHRPSTLVQVPVVHGITGEYLALGDSYSAGEGLMPFESGTEDFSVGGNRCHRSQMAAYSRLLTFEPRLSSEAFLACSGAVIPDIYHQFFPDQGHPAHGVGPQVTRGQNDVAQDDVGLVTLTIGGNDVLFSDVLFRCFSTPNCLVGDHAANASNLRESCSDRTGGLVWPRGVGLASWGPGAEQAAGECAGELFMKLRNDFPKARIVVIGYPYLFPDGPAGIQPDDCASILRRYSQGVRRGIRRMTDELNNLLYERAVEADVEFISPKAAWAGHEPCGSKGQYVNALKPIFKFKHPLHPLDDGSFHPTAAGQSHLAALVACYLNLNPQRPMARAIVVSGIKSPSEYGLADPPGSQASLRC